MLPPPAEKLQNFFGVFLQFQIGVDTQKIEKLYEDAVIDNLLSRDAYKAQKAHLVEHRDNAQKAEAEIQAEIFEQTRDRSIYAEQYQLYTEY